MLKNGKSGSFVSGIVVVVLAVTFCSSSITAQAALVVNPNSINMFRDSRGPNDVGVTPGDRFQYGANVVGGSAGAFLSAVYPPSGFVDPPSPCSPISTNPNFCSNSTPFNASRIAQPWNFTFTRGADSLTVAGPSLSGTQFQVPHPTSVTISGAGTTPTISWTLPAGFTPDAFRVQIFDRDPARIRPNGNADIIHTAPVASGATSYTLPATLSDGEKLKLGGSYAINFQVIQTRDHVDFSSNSNALILTRSNSWFAFSPLPTGTPNVHLPEIDNGVFRFTIDHVGPNEITFIDPAVTIGYSYAIGPGDPNFASVLLPHVGDDIFDLIFGGLHHTLLAGSQFFFPAGGVSAFDVLGIETSAGLDPTNPVGFVTGLTFVTDGHFTGTMTPLSVNISAVPEPSPLALLAIGLGAFGITRRRKRA